MRVLALDSSSALLSCALWEDGRAVAESVHTEKAGDVLPEALLALAPLESIDALAAGIGPGSFTGLRVGLSTLKALSYARKLPVAGASSLRALALSARRPSERSRVAQRAIISGGAATLVRCGASGVTGRPSRPTPLPMLG